MERDKFFAIFCNGQCSYADEWEDLCKNDQVKLYLHGHFHHSHTTNGGTFIPWYRFEILDELGNHSTYRIGDFEVIQIYPDVGIYAFQSRKIDILDTRLGSKHDYYMRKGKGDNYVALIQPFYEELNEILTTLNELGSWKAYEQSIKLQEKDKEIKSLTANEEKLQNEIDMLKKELVRAKKGNWFRDLLMRKNRLLKSSKCS